MAANASAMPRQAKLMHQSRSHAKEVVQLACKRHSKPRFGIGPGFRLGKDRGQPIDVAALQELVRNVYQWGTPSA